MGNNLLQNWKDECYLLSSPLSISKQLERSDVDSIFQIFADYFGLNFFNIVFTESSLDSKSNWIHFLLVNPKRPACIAALFEIANLLHYLQTLPKSIQKKFKSLFSDPRQFRDLFFELYVFRLLDYNKIANTKKPMEGKKELDVVCTINEIEFLGECRKVYAPNINLLDIEKYFMEKLYLKLQKLNKGFGLIGTIKFHNPNSKNIKEVIEAKLNKFIKGFNEQTFHTIDYHDKDEQGELSVINYTEVDSIEIEKNFAQYHLVFKVIPPHNPVPNVPNHYRVELKSGFQIPQSKVTGKLFSALNEKSEQHANSKYQNKIYFIDSETIPDFEMPIFRMDSMFEEEKIKEFVNGFSENEIFCFIRREYMEDIPKISIKAIGKNIDEKIKHRLESLKTNFDYHIEVSYKKPIRINQIQPTQKKYNLKIRASQR